MRRKWFFWLEKLKITPHERVTVAGLLLLLLALHIMNLLVKPYFAERRPGFDAIEEEFRGRSEILAHREAELMSRYYPGETQNGTGSAHDPPVTPGKININTATASELEILPGIGPVYAGRIIAYRNEHGAFESVDELILIRGIGPVRLEALRPLVEL